MNRGTSHGATTPAQYHGWFPILYIWEFHKRN